MSSYQPSQSTQWSIIYFEINSTNSNNQEYRLSIDGLAKMEYYVFELSSNNTSGLGWGSETTALVYTIDSERRNRPDPPNQPTISKSSIKSSELSIGWNLNSDNYSPIRYFTIQMLELSSGRPKRTLSEYLSLAYEASVNQSLNQADDFNWRTIFVYKVTGAAYSNNYRLTIRGRDKQGNFILKPNGFLYKFRISATNDVGTSEFSQESSVIRTKQSKPRLYSELAHKNLDKIDVKVLSSSKISLTWFEAVNLAKLNDNDYLSKYKLVYKLVGVNNKIPQLSLNPLLAYAGAQPNNIAQDYDFYESSLSSSSASNPNMVELLIEYKNTTKTFLNSSDDPRFGLIKHEFVLDNNQFIENGTYEFNMFGINSIGESSKFLSSKKLVYIEDRLPELDFGANNYTVSSIMKK